MSRKHHGGPAPVPPGNRPQSGPARADVGDESDDTTPTASPAGFQEEDPKRRLGDFTGTGEHSRQQPGPLNDGDQHSR